MSCLQILGTQVCVCVRVYACVWLRESQFQVFVMNPNKSCLLPDPAVIQHGRQIKKKRGNLELLFFMLGRPLFWAPAQSWKLTERSCRVQVISQTHDILVTFQRQRACVMYFNWHWVLLSLQGHFNWSSRRWIKSSQVHLHTQSGYCWWQLYMRLALLEQNAVWQGPFSLCWYFILIQLN